MGFYIRFDPPPDDGPWFATGMMEWPLLPFVGRFPRCEWQNDAGRKEWVRGEYVNLPD